MELQVSHRIRTEVQEKDILRGEEAGDRSDVETAVQVERSEYIGGRSMPGSCAHACGDSAEDKHLELHGVPERQEQPDDI